MDRSKPRTVHTFLGPTPISSVSPSARFPRLSYPGRSRVQWRETDVGLGTSYYQERITIPSFPTPVFSLRLVRRVNPLPRSSVSNFCVHWRKPVVRPLFQYGQWEVVKLLWRSLHFKFVNTNQLPPPSTLLIPVTSRGAVGA